MLGILLTQNSSFIIGPVSKILGYLMEGIFWLLDKVGIPNIGLAIIIFTIVIYLLLLPLTIKQQKFSKLSAKMNPELQAVQAKYKNKKDNDSMAAMQQETQAVYAKYGVSPTGSCLQLLIQMPILFALYRVIYSIPAYVAQVKDAFFPLVDDLIMEAKGSEFIQTLSASPQFAKQFKNELFTSGSTEYVQNTFIDVLNKASIQDWSLLSETFPNLSEQITNTLDQLNRYNNFLGLNIGNSPLDIIKTEWVADERGWILIIGALLIPILSAATQWINLKLSPQASTGTDPNANNENPMMASMKTMNMIMPVMSAVFCFTLPAGMGLYWIAGSVVRSIQQVCINKYIDKMDIDAVIAKNTEKYNEKLKKKGIMATGINNSAKKNTKTFNTAASSKPVKTQEERQEEIKKATEYYNKVNKNNSSSGSIASKANMVKNYNEKNNKQ